MSIKQKKSGILPQIIVAVVIALLVGSSAPWWWKVLFNPEKPPQVNIPVSPPSAPPSHNERDEISVQPTPDFSGGTRRVYSADFSLWPRKDSEHGSVKLEFGNSYVLEPSSDIWIGPGRIIEIPSIEGDFVFDIRFRIQYSYPLSLHFRLIGGGTDAESIDVILTVFKNNATYGLSKGRLRSGGGLSVPHVVTEETIAEMEQIPLVLRDHDWSKGSKLTLKREGGRIQFFVNNRFVKDFAVSLFSVMKISVGASGKSKIIITSIEARVKG